MRNIPLALRQAKNALGQDSPWLLLVDLILTDGTAFYLVANNEDIEFQGRTYTAFPFQLSYPNETSNGDIPTFKLSVSNITRILQSHLERLTGALDSTVILRIVNAGLLEEDYSELEMELSVLSVESTAQWIVANCGASNPLRRRFPLFRYIARHCNWVNGFYAIPRWPECGYTGELTTCTGTLEDCEAHNNTARYGGHPGLKPGGLRIAQ